MKDPSIWMWWYLMLLGIPLMVLALFVNDMIMTPARDTRSRMRQRGREVGHVGTI